MNTSDLGLTVRLHRRASGLSRESLARLANVKKNAVLELENGNHSVKLEKVLRIFSVLNISFSLTSPVLNVLEQQKEKYEI